MKNEDASFKLFLVLFHKQTEVGEFLLGTLGTLWGLWLINPWTHTFSLPSYAGFFLFNELYVGLFFLLLGLSTMLAAGFRLRYVRYSALFINILAWMFVAVLFLMKAPANTAFPVYMMISFMSTWLYIRLVLFQDIYDYIREVLEKHMSS